MPVLLAGQVGRRSLDDWRVNTVSGTVALVDQVSLNTRMFPTSGSILNDIILL